MGHLARSNPRSFEGGKRKADVQKARLAKVVAQLRTQDQLDVFLGSFPESVRDQVHCVIEPMLPPLLPVISMIEVYPVDPSTDGSWVTLKACSHRVIRQMDCGCWAAGYGYSVEHAAERVKIAIETHQHEAPVPE